MCIVVDVNVFSHVFSTAKQKDSFRPVKDWISRGDGFLVFGGKKYKNELQRMPRCLGVVAELKKGGHAVAISDGVVDETEEKIKLQTEGTDCDDQHIIALLAVSRCPLVCTNDKRAHKYILDKNYYPEGMKRVRIYGSKKHKSLLNKKISKDILKNTA